MDYITFSTGFKKYCHVHVHVSTIVCKGKEPISSDTGIEKIDKKSAAQC